MEVKQPEALWLAESLEITNGLFVKKDAAAELRRLHEENQRLLGALQELLGCDKTRTSFGALMRARDALAKATGDTA